MSAITLDTINEINRLDRLARSTANEAVKLAQQTGILLLKVKSELSHGDFTKWLKANVTVSQRQAQRYMAVAQGKPMSIRAFTVKNDTVSLLDNQQTVPQGKWIPEDGYIYLFKDAEGSTYWVTPSIKPAGGFHVCKHYNGERLSSKDFFLHYTVLSEIHDEDFTSQYYIGTRRPVSVKYGVDSVLHSYGLDDIKNSLLTERKCEGFDRPVGEPDPQYWYWDVRHPEDQRFLDEMEQGGHINDHGAIVLDFRNTEASPF